MPSERKMAETHRSLLYGIESTDFKKRLAVLKILLNYGAHVNAKTVAKETPLHLAVRNDCLEVVQLLIEYDARVEDINRDRRTPLHLCAEFSDSKMAELLLKHCEQKTKPTPVRRDYKIPDCYTAKVATLLFKYCKHQAEKLHEKILDEFRNYPYCLPGYDLNKKPLLKDCKQFWIWLRKALYKYRSCPYDFDSTRLDTAIEFDNIEMCLLKRVRQVIVNTTFANNETPLHRAVESFRRSISNDFQMQLLDGRKRLSRSGRKSTKQSEMKIRVMTESEKMTNKYIKDPDIQSSKKKTKLSDRFTFKQQNADGNEVVYLRQLSPDFSIDCNHAKTNAIISENVKSYVNGKDFVGYDALLKAVEFNQPHIVSLLMRNGADPCSVTSQGYAALHVAADLCLSSNRRQLKSSNPVPMIDTLTASGEFNVNALTYKTETPLHLAYRNCECGLTEKDSEESQRRRETQDMIISLLLKAKADVNQQDCEGMTPLMIASEIGCHHLVEILLDSNLLKVDLNARDKYGETALTKAARMHHTDIVKALLNSGARADLEDNRGFTALHSALHDPNEFKSLFKLSKHGSKDTGPRNNNTNEKVMRKSKNRAFVRIKNSSNGEQHRKNNLKNTIIAILTRKGFQFQTLDFVNHTPLHFSVKSEIQSTRSELKAQNKLDKIINRDIVHEKRPFQLEKLDSLWSHDLRWQQKSPLFWLAALCIVTAEQGSIQPAVAVVEKIASLRDNKGRTVLHYAAILSGFGRSPDGGLGLVFKSPELFKTLLKSGCEIGAQDIYGRTPLHYLDASNKNLLLRLFELIGMKTTAEQRRLTFGDKLERKDIDDKTVTELWSLRDAGRRRNKIRSEFNKTVKDANLGIKRLDNDRMRIFKGGRNNFEKGISWTIWSSDIGDYAYRNALTSDLTREMRRFIERLAKAIEREEPWFTCKPVLVGSAFEGTKIDSPDEFDFDFILTKFSDLVEVIASAVAPEGFVHLRKKSGVTLPEADEKRFFDKEGILKTNEISCRFQIVLMEALQDPSFWDGEPHFESMDAESMMKRFVRCYDRYKYGIDHSDLTDQRLNPSICTTVRLKQTRAIDGKYLLNDISLDLVPCIHVDGWWPDKARSDIRDGLKSIGCNLVFDQPQRKYPWVPFGENYARISFAPAESQIIRESSPTAKAAYMVCKHLIKDKPQMTYVLKTCLLYCIEANDLKNEKSLNEGKYYSSVTREELRLWVEKLMLCYLTFFLQDFYPCYPMPSFCLPIGDFLKSNHMLLLVTDESDYKFLAYENQSYRWCVEKVYSTIFDLFRKVCTHDTEISLPKPQPLFDSFNHNDFILQLKASFG